MADKSRIYLEQAISELRDLERQGVFSKQEARLISRKRSEFEHRINATRCQPQDFIRYARYETNLEALRIARASRLNVKSESYGSGSRWVRYILERGTRRFHGDVTLWLQYVDFLRGQKATKLLGKVLTSFLKLHPSKPELWIYASSTVMQDNGDISEARSYMQHGLRLNRYSRGLWLEYAKLELIFLSKLHARRKILHLDPHAGSHVQHQSSLTDEEDGNVISLPSNAELEAIGTNHSALVDLHQFSDDEAMQGKLPVIIFDIALSTIRGDVAFAVSFFNLFASFHDLPCRRVILGHVDACLMRLWPTIPDALYCHAVEPIIGIAWTGSDFPPKFSIAVSRFFGGLETTEAKVELYDKFCRFLGTCLAIMVSENCDPYLKLAIRTTITRCLKQGSDQGMGTADRIELLHALENLV